MLSKEAIGGVRTVLTVVCLLEMNKVTQGVDLQERSKGQLRKALIKHCLVPTLVGAFVLAAPSAYAAQLQSWQFESSQNRLSFRTSGSVQPQAQLLSNPTRLVIDLPGTTLGRRTAREQLGGTIKEIRVGQFNRQTSRIVVELADGYTLDPQQVKFHGSSPSQWSVQLPTPQRAISRPPSDANSTTASTATVVRGLLQDIQVRDEGFILRTTGEKPEIDLRRSSDRTWISLELRGVTLSPQLLERNLQIDRMGVDRLEVLEVSNSPPLTRVILNLRDPSKNWQARVSEEGGVVLWPEGGSAPALNATNSQLATIESIELANNGSELVVKANRPVAYKTEWDRATLAYRLTFFSSQLAQQLNNFRPPSGSSVLWVRPTQENPDTVVVLVQPAAGIQVRGVQQSSADRIAVQLQRSTVVSRPPDTVPISVPDTNRPVSVPPPATNNPPPSNPRVPNSRIAIVIDPGHGGRDPGAIGIGGIREKDVVIDISRQVTAILEQNGVNVIMTRQDDRTLDLAPRTQLANRLNADLFVSIHANAINMSRPDVNGVETYYYQSGRRLAYYIHNSILQNFGDMPDRGVRRARFYVLRHTDMPAVLVETGFVTGRDDARRLANAAERTRMAEAIARGILQYVRATR